MNTFIWISKYLKEFICFIIFNNFYISFTIMILHYLNESIPDDIWSLFPMPDDFWHVPVLRKYIQIILILASELFDIYRGAIVVKR